MGHVLPGLFLLAAVAIYPQRAAAQFDSGLGSDAARTVITEQLEIPFEAGRALTIEGSFNSAPAASGFRQFIPADKDLEPFDIAVPGELQGLSEEVKRAFPLVTATIRADPQFPSWLTTERVDLGSVLAWQRGVATGENPLLEELRPKFSALAASTTPLLNGETILTPGARRIQEHVHLAAYTATIEETGEALRSGTVPAELLPTLAEIVAKLEAELAGKPPRPKNPCRLETAVNKTIYCRADIFVPGDYRRIAANSHGVVGIGKYVNKHRDPQIICTGMLIGKNLVLTARHCLQHDQQDSSSSFFKRYEMRVSFDFERDGKLDQMARQNEEIVEIISTGRAASDTLPELDFALLKIKGTPETKTQFLHGSPPVPRSRQLCMSTRTLHRGDPVYKIGHPGGIPRSVIDNGRVLFPFVADEASMNAMTVDVYAEIFELGKVASNDAKDLLLQWINSYRPELDRYEHFSDVWGGSPTLGLELDTSGGNSGGPVFNRRSHYVVAVFTKGQRDDDRPRVPSWQEHEAALPVQAILDHMNSVDADWLADHNVCIYGKDGNPEALWSRGAAHKKHCSRVCG